MKDDFKKQIKIYAGIVAKAMTDDDYMQHLTAMGQDEMDSFLNTLARINVAKILFALSGKEIIGIKPEDFREINNLLYLISVSMSCAVNGSDTEDAEYISKAIGNKLNFSEEIIEEVTQTVTNVVASMDVDPADIASGRTLH